MGPSTELGSAEKGAGKARKSLDNSGGRLLVEVRQRVLRVTQAWWSGL